MFDGLGGEHAALVVLELAVELLGQLAGSGHHHVERLFGVTRAWQAKEETHRRGAEQVDIVQIERARLDRVGHGEQHFAVTGHAFVTMEDIHLAKTQAAFEDVLQECRALETAGIAADHADDQDFFGSRLIVDRLARRTLGGRLVREIVIAAAEARAIIDVEVQVALVRLGNRRATALATLGRRLAGFTQRGAHRRQVVLVQLRLFMGIQHTGRPQQLGGAVVIRQVGQVSVQPELELALATAHAAPAIKKNTGNDNNADDDQPLAQTDFHVIRFKTWRQLYVLTDVLPTHTKN